MFSGKDNTSVLEDKVNLLIKSVENDESGDLAESLRSTHNKNELYNALKQVSDNNKELLKQNINGEGENMDATDRELIKNDIKEILEDKLKEKFGNLENNLKNIEEGVGQTCVDGKCFTTKLDDFEDKLNSIDDVKLEVAGIKSGVDDKMKGIYDSFSDLSKGVTDSVSDIGEKFDTSISDINERLDKTCTGVDCLNERFNTQDVQNDTVTCPQESGGCGTTFLVSENTVGDYIICPECGIKLKRKA